MCCALIRRSFELLLTIIAPPTCAYCHRYLEKREILCQACMRTVRPVVSWMVPCTQSVSITVFAASVYQEPIRSLIVAKRWSNRLASIQLGELVWETTYFKYATVDYLVPIPLHWSRQAWRGYNQAYEMASVLAHKRGCGVEPLLRRVRHTRFQSHLPVAQRSKNVKDVFALARNVDSSFITGKHIVLVDDLMTTGSTLREAAKVLLPFKPASIAAVVAARAR